MSEVYEGLAPFLLRCIHLAGTNQRATVISTDQEGPNTYAIKGSLVWTHDIDKKTYHTDLSLLLNRQNDIRIRVDRDTVQDGALTRRYFRGCGLLEGWTPTNTIEASVNASIRAQGFDELAEGFLRCLHWTATLDRVAVRQSATDSSGTPFVDGMLYWKGVSDTQYVTGVHMEISANRGIKIDVTSDNATFEYYRACPLFDWTNGLGAIENAVNDSISAQRRETAKDTYSTVVKAYRLGRFAKEVWKNR